MITKEGQDLPVDKITADNYKVKDKEANLYHIKMERIDYDRKGKKNSTPFIQKVGINAYKSCSHEWKRQDFTVEILHDPIKAKAENEAKAKAAMAAKAAKAAEEKAAKEAADREALKAQIKQEAMAEVAADIEALKAQIAALTPKK